jgi:hypothetical protein
MKEKDLIEISNKLLDIIFKLDFENEEKREYILHDIYKIVRNFQILVDRKNDEIEYLKKRGDIKWN